MKIITVVAREVQQEEAEPAVKKQTKVGRIAHIFHHVLYAVGDGGAAVDDKKLALQVAFICTEVNVMDTAAYLDA